MAAGSSLPMRGWCPGACGSKPDDAAASREPSGVGVVGRRRGAGGVVRGREQVRWRKDPGCDAWPREVERRPRNPSEEIHL